VSSAYKDGIDSPGCHLDTPTVSTAPVTIRVVPATERDIPLILTFIQRLAEYERLADECIATEEGIRRTLFEDRPAAEVLFAYDAGLPVGFALFYYNYSTFLAQRGLFLEDLFVIPAARGRGVGYALLSALAEIALTRDCARMEWSVLKWNQLAIDFYLRIGAQPLENWTTYRLAGEPLRRLATRP
jgi:GNAT superfamily N-acetyltransferase